MIAISMTAKRKPNGELEVVHPGISAQTFRYALLALVLTMHPLGRQALRSLGFELPEPPPAVELTKKVDQLSIAVDEVARRLEKTEQNTLSLSARFERFDVDFQRFRAASEPKTIVE